MTAWLEHLANDVVGDVIAEFLIAVAVFSAGRFAVFAGRRPLRTRLVSGILALGIIGAAVQWLGLPSLISLGAFALASAALVLYVLNDISRVGIVNSFGSTTRGITPVKSLQLVKRKFDFLGIGAKKLSDNSSEFAATVSRCRKANGRIRLLLSSPKNPALKKLAERIGRDSQSYSSRVRESIRQILHVKEQEGGEVITIKLYELGSDFSFPHFRLMFTDDRICILSHVLWNDSEGMDNPQLIIRSADKDPDESLYSAYQQYFDDLWNSPDSKEITSIDDPRLSL